MYFWDSWQAVQEADSGGTVSKTWVYGEAIDEVVKGTIPEPSGVDIDGDSTSGESAVDVFFHHNSLGSVVAVTDVEGDVVESYTYAPYGAVTILDHNSNVITSTRIEQPWAFTGRRADFEEGSGLLYYRLRFYDPVAGRFVSRDPIGMWGDPGQRGNAQNYTGNNPVNRVDPRGDTSIMHPVPLGGGLSPLEAARGAARQARDHEHSLRKKYERAPNQWLWQEILDAMHERLAAEARLRELEGRRFDSKFAEAASTLLDIAWKESPPGRLKDVVDDLREGKFVDVGVGLLPFPGVKRLTKRVGRGKGSRSRRTRDHGESGAKVDKKPDGICFVAGTLVATPKRLQKIDDVRVGQRVLADSSNAPDTVEIAPEHWALLRVSMPNPDGSRDTITASVLRPRSWIERRLDTSTNTIEMDLVELGFSGSAKVHRIEPCPRLEDGEGRLVLATFAHLNGHVLELRFGLAETLVESTRLHRFWSVTRQAWVHAERLWLGEFVLTPTGPLALTSRKRKPGVHRVFNLEVEGAHNYFVSEDRILVHNTGCRDDRMPGGKGRCANPYCRARIGPAGWRNRAGRRLCTKCWMKENPGHREPRDLSPPARDEWNADDYPGGGAPGSGPGPRPDGWSTGPEAPELPW